MRTKINMFTCLALVFLFGQVALSSAAVSVNGVAGQDADGASPFETINAAALYAIAHNDAVVTLDTNATLSAINLIDVGWPSTFTIRAGDGFTPAVDGLNNVMVTTSASQVNLEGIQFTGASELTQSGTLMVAGNITVKGCTINDATGTGIEAAYSPTVIQPTDPINRTLVVEDCTITGRVCVWNGKGSANTVLRHNTFNGVDSVTWCSSIMFNGFASGGTTVIDRCRVSGDNRLIEFNGGNFALGPLTVTNTYFSLTTRSSAVWVDYWTPMSSTYLFCTFRAPENQLSVPLQFRKGAQHYTIKNCLFDLPMANSIAVVTEDKDDDVADLDGNAYNMAEGFTFAQWGDTTAQPTKETGTVFVSGINDGLTFVTDAFGHLLADSTLASTLAINRGIPLTPAINVDIDGVSRPQGAAADIGASELPSSAPNAAASWTLY